MVGGGDTAMEDATFLSKFASDVKIINRREELRASAIMADRARDTENIEFVTPYVVERFEAGESGSLDKVVLNHVGGGEDRELDIDGAFIAIGHRPNSDLVKDQLELDENGYVLVEGRSIAHRAAGRLRRRRPRGPRLPPGGHRRRHGLHGRPRRGGIPARHAARPRRSTGRRQQESSAPAT